MQPKEEVFQRAKKIKLGVASPHQAFELLSKKIKTQWNSNLINGDVYEYVQMTNPMRLRLILDNVEDLTPLPKLWNERQELIGKAFIEIINQLKVKEYNKFDLSNLQVDYFLFDKLAFQECVNNIDIGLIRSEFGHDKFWSIQKFWNYITVFYLTNEEVKENEANGLSQAIDDKIQTLAKSVDQFEILENQKIKIAFDSKEKFDRTGGGYNYYR